MNSHRSSAPLIAAIILLTLPVPYVGSYLTQVMPGAAVSYVGGSEFSSWIFWPLEQIDRKVRPGAWVGDY